MISTQNTTLPHLGADIRPRPPEPVTDHPHIAVYSLAELFRADPAAAMRIADKSRADYDLSREKNNADRAR